ncbi:MAG: hypothetical protein ACOY0T_39930 [Myxococcota bacterium]
MIHFGYDFYVYLVGMPMTSQTRDIASTSGLFVEPFRSPYVDTE